MNRRAFLAAMGLSPWDRPSIPSTRKIVASTYLELAFYSEGMERREVAGVPLDGREYRVGCLRVRALADGRISILPEENAPPTICSYSWPAPQPNLAA